MEDREDGRGRRLRLPVIARIAVAGLLLVLLGAALLVFGLAADGRAEKVLGIVAMVLGLGCLRAYQWTRKARLMGQIGRDLHVPPRD